MTDTTPVLCGGPCRPEAHGGPRRAMPAYAICGVCEERCWENLHWIADHWADLEEQLTAPEGAADGMPRAKIRDAVGISLNPKVVALRRKVYDELRYWVQVILDENPGFTGPKDDVVAFARYLARQHRRITRHHSPGVAAALPIVAHDLRREMYPLAFPSGGRLYTPEPVIPCAEHTETDQGERVPCPGHYRAWVTDRADGIPDLTCSEDRSHVLSPAGFRRAGRQTMKAEAALRLVQEITGEGERMGA